MLGADTPRATMAEGFHGLSLLMAAAAVGLAAAAPDMTQLPVDRAQQRADQAMVTQSPAQAIEDAIRYDPVVAAALQSNASNLYLLKKVTYTNGTAQDLGLPNEQLLPNGAPDRVRVADKIVYSSPINTTDVNENPTSPVSTNEQPVGIHASLQLVPVPIN